METIQQATTAAKNGADQLELCADLYLDGLTPSYKLCSELLSKVHIPIKVMLRNRGGDFVYTKTDITQMLEQLELLKTLDISGIVFGALTVDHKIDLKTIQIIAKASHPLPITIHKCIDLVENYQEAIDKLKTIPNVKYLLTSGGKSTAAEGINQLLKMKSIAAPQIEIIAAGKITRQNIDNLHEQLGLSFYHGRHIVNMDNSIA